MMNWLIFHLKFNNIEHIIRYDEIWLWHKFWKIEVWAIVIWAKLDLSDTESAKKFPKSVSKIITVIAQK